MRKRRRGAVYVAIVAVVFAASVIPAFSPTAAEASDAAAAKSGSTDEVSLLKQQVAEQQKEIEALQANMKAMKERIDQGASGAQSASPHAPNLGQVANTTPVIPAGMTGVVLATWPRLGACGDADWAPLAPWSILSFIAFMFAWSASISFCCSATCCFRSDTSSVEPLFAAAASLASAAVGEKAGITLAANTTATIATYTAPLLRLRILHSSYLSFSVQFWNVSVRPGTRYYARLRMLSHGHTNVIFL